MNSTAVVLDTNAYRDICAINQGADPTAELVLKQANLNAFFVMAGPRAEGAGSDFAEPRVGSGRLAKLCVRHCRSRFPFH